MQQTELIKAAESALRTRSALKARMIINNIASREMEKAQTRILIVDDEPSVLRLLQRVVQKTGSACSLASSAGEAKTLLDAEGFDLLLCDLYLPGESGLELIEWVQARQPRMGMIMISGEDDPQVAGKALELGAYGYIIKPFKINEIFINISSALRRKKLEAEARVQQQSLEQKVAERTAKLEEILEGIIQVVARTVETRDPYTAGHQLRVADLARAMAAEMALPPEQVQGIYMAGLVHDVGKLAVPSEILSKPGRLSTKEFALIKDHPQIGRNILQGVSFPWPVAEMVYQHHERLDGSGYPQGLQKGEILQEACVLAVADVVEAMSSYRPYRPGLGLDLALEEIEKNNSRLYASDVVTACLRLFREKGYSLGQG